MLIPEPGRTQWDLKWRIFGIPCRVHPAFWLVSLLFAYIEGFPFVYTAIGVVCMFVSVVVHEYGHALAGRYYGDNQNRTVLYWFGGLCIDGKGVPERWPRIVLLLWGPGAGFVLGVIALAVFLCIRHDVIPTHDLRLMVALDYLMMINFGWGIINLMPVVPLDGGQIFRELVRWKAPHRGDVFTFTVSLYASILLVFASIGYVIYNRSHGAKGDTRDLFPVFLFVGLAVSSYINRRNAILYGDMEGYPSERREAWEQDPDWWKRGGR